MNARKAKLARKNVYGDRDPLDRGYRVASDKRGGVVGKFVTIEGKKRLVVPTIVSDYNRQLYQQSKKEKS